MVTENEMVNALSRAMPSTGKDMDPEVPLIAVMLDQLIAMLSEQREVIEMLSDRLNPVTVPYPREDENNKAVSSRGWSSMAERIDEAVAKVSVNTNRIDNIRRNLQL